MHIAQWIICGCPHSRHGAQYVTIMMDPAKVLSRKPRTKFSRAKVLSISLSALRSRSSRSFSSPFNRAVSFSTHCSADVPFVECNFPEVQIFQGVSYVCKSGMPPPFQRHNIPQKKVRGSAQNYQTIHISLRPLFLLSVTFSGPAKSFYL